jgi:hypothetical protein
LPSIPLFSEENLNDLSRCRGSTLQQHSAGQDRDTEGFREDKRGRTGEGEWDRERRGEWDRERRGEWGREKRRVGQGEKRRGEEEEQGEKDLRDAPMLIISIH